MSLSLLRRRAPWAAAAAALILAAGCSSDDFGPTGSSLPADVSQDSLAVELTLRGAREELRVDLPLHGPEADDPLQDRQILYLGGSPVTGWKATPLLRYSFQSPDSIDAATLQAEDLKRVDLGLRLMNRDSERGAPLRLALYELNQPLDPDYAGDLAGVLGDSLGFFEVNRGQTVTLELLEGDPSQVQTLRDRALQWIVSGGQDGLALVNVSTDSVLVGLAASEFDVARNGGLLTDDQIPEGAIIGSRIAVEIQRTGEEPDFVTYDVEQDVTLFETPADRSPVTVGAHVPARAWLDFDLTALPRAATINGAELVLHFDRSRITLSGFPGTETYEDTDGDGVDERVFQDSTLLPRVVTVLTYEATREEALSGDLAQASQVQNALTIFGTDRVLVGTEEDDTILRINVTDFVQRLVNGLFGDTPPGLMVVLDEERLIFFEAGFHDSAAAEDLQPRIEITYTPPADFVD